VSTSSSGALGNSVSYAAQPSDDGRYVCFFSLATNLVAGDTNAQGDVFWKDMQTGALQRVNVSSSGAQANNETIWPSISGDGQTVTFCSAASNLVSGDTNGQHDLFARDIPGGVTTRLNVQPSGAQANSYVQSPSALSTDGRFVIFASLSTNLVAGDTNGFQDIFIRDRQLLSTERVSFASTGAQTNSDNFVPHMTPDKRVLTFTSTASNIVPNDTNGLRDIFACTLGGPGSPFCFGDGTQGSCPCSNNGAAGHGCDNSAGTQGALLAASGTTNPDALVLTSSGELPSASSVFLQGNSNLGAGIVFGDGLRCAGGLLKRIGLHAAVGGTTSYPQAGDLSITQQSANLGDPIAPGSTRYYQVYYRDPSPGFCAAPAGNTWNISSGLAIVW
jgi:hypothetical protein